MLIIKEVSLRGILKIKIVESPTKAKNNTIKFNISIAIFIVRQAHYDPEYN